MTHTKDETGDSNSRMAATVGLMGLSQNPPYRDRILATMDYLRHFAVDSVYVAETGPTEFMTAYKRRVYDTLHLMCWMEIGPRQTRVSTMWPTADWFLVWKNLAETPVTGVTKAVWYKVINNILPTKERIHRIRITPRVGAATVTDRTHSCTAHGVRGGGTNMDIDETETGVDTSDNPREDTERMAHETSLHNVAPDMEASNAIDFGRRLLSNTTATRTDLARPY